jgi:ribosomal protein S6
MDKEFKKYEIGFLARNENGGDDVNKTLTSHRCELIESGVLNRMRLAYPIKKETAGFFGYYHFLAEPSAIEKIKNELDLNFNVLRFLIITPPAEKQLPSAAKIEKRRKQVVSKEIEPKAEIKKPMPAPSVLTNEALEKKLEEILK